MKEKTVVGIIFLILLLAGGAAYYIQSNVSGFNFYKSELTINGSQIQEKLFYQLDKDYHTLFRNFQSYIANPGTNVANSISIQEVECSDGTPYFRTISQCYNNVGIAATCMAYTEDNEYGCGFGEVYGFSKGEKYWIGAEYELKPENLFKINNNYYIKFIAYNENSHKKLITGENFIVTDGAIANKKYLPDEQVIIYIPYKGDMTGFNLINQNDFKFDNKTSRHLFLFFVLLIPGILFFITWFFFGREKSEVDVPERLSLYPNKRKAWEVAAFFNPPFGSNNRNILPTMLTDFYQRKIINTKIENKKLYVKINNNENLDKVEKNFMNILRFFQKTLEQKDGYFLLDPSKLRWSDKTKLTSIYSLLSSSINNEKKEYLSSLGLGFSAIAFIIAGAFGFLTTLLNWIVILFFFFAIISIFIIGISTNILTKFKKDYYLEYRQWQSFKRFLKTSPSMKLHGHKGTIIWGEFLVYATALGVASKVLKEMKDQKIITEQQYNTYFVISSPSVLSSFTGGFSSGSGGFGGGFGGAGGGGVGGGGGGGR